jgi:hypothetical protein
LEKLLKLAIENANLTTWLAFLVSAIILTVLKNIKSIIEYSERKDSKREKYIKDMLRIKSIDAITKNFLEEEINCIVFRKMTGITADRVNRETIASIIERSNGELPAFRIARAWRFLKMKDRKLHVQIKKVDTAEHYFNRGAAAVMTLFTVAVVLQIFILKGTTPVQMGALVAMGLLGFSFASFLIFQDFPYRVAKAIEPIIIRVQQEGANHVEEIANATALPPIVASPPIGELPPPPPEVPIDLAGEVEAKARREINANCTSANGPRPSRPAAIISKRRSEAYRRARSKASVLSPSFDTWILVLAAMEAAPVLA